MNDAFHLNRYHHLFFPCGVSWYGIIIHVFSTVYSLIFYALLVQCIGERHRTVCMVIGKSVPLPFQPCDSSESIRVAHFFSLCHFVDSGFQS